MQLLATVAADLILYGIVRLIEKPRRPRYRPRHMGKRGRKKERGRKAPSPSDSSRKGLAMHYLVQFGIALATAAIAYAVMRIARKIGGDR